MSTKVSHTLTITESTPNVQTASKLSCSIGAFRTKDVLLMSLEVVIAITCFLMMSSSEQSFAADDARFATLSFVICLFMFFLATALLLISHLISPMAAEVLPKTSFQFLHNLLAFMFYFLSGLSYVILISKEHHNDPTREKEVIASVLGLGNAGCYFLSTFFSYQSFKSS